MDTLVSSVGGYWVDAVAVLAAIIAYLATAVRRSIIGEPYLQRDIFKSAMFAGATVALLLLLASACFNEEMFRMMLSQERTLLCLALLHACFDEFLDFAALWKKKG